MEANYYVYEHKKENGEVFYVGLGSQKNYSRAYMVHGRNRFWYHITDKHDFTVEIIKDNITFEDACNLEMKLISRYGRRNTGEGTLCNLTDGGEGTLNIVKTEESIAKWRESNKGKQDGELNIMFGKTRGRHHLSKDVVNLETGIFYDCAIDASEAANIDYNRFKCKLGGKSRNDTLYIYVDDWENGTNIDYPDHKNYKKVINIRTKETFQSIVKAAKSINISPATLSFKLRGYCNNDTHFQFLNDYKKGLPLAEKRGWKKYVLNTQSGVFYNSIKEASIYEDIKYHSLKNYFRPNSIYNNKTNLITV